MYGELLESLMNWL